MKKDLCSCGGLKDRRSKNCAKCYRSSINGENNPNFKHGKKKSKEYMIWASMIKRCHNKLDKSYCRYGLKGIKVCKEWRESFLSFYSDMGSKPEGKSIDRIDNKKGYSKENCKWSTPTEQALNRGDFKNKTSKYKGVYFSKRNKKWAVSIKKNKKSHWGGYYDTEKQASYAYKKLWNKLYDSRKLI